MQWLARASPVGLDGSGGRRAAGLGPAAGPLVSAQASGAPLAPNALFPGRIEEDAVFDVRRIPHSSTKTSAVNPTQRDSPGGGPRGRPGGPPPLRADRGCASEKPKSLGQHNPRYAPALCRRKRCRRVLLGAFIAEASHVVAVLSAPRRCNCMFR